MALLRAGFPATTNITALNVRKVLSRLNTVMERAAPEEARGMEGLLEDEVIALGLVDTSLDGVTPPVDGVTADDSTLMETYPAVRDLLRDYRMYVRHSLTEGHVTTCGEVGKQLIHALEDRGWTTV